MAARRNKSQARRSGGNAGLPGWAWLVIGVLVALLLVAALMLGGLITPRSLDGGDGFFRPQPNPDAQPAPVDEDAEAVVPEDMADGAGEAPAKPRAPDPGEAPAEDKEYDFFTLLPGRETPMTEAEIAATAKAEERRAQAQADAQARAAAASASAATATAPTPAARPLPVPVDDGAAATPTPAPARPVTPPASTAGTPTPAPPAAASPTAPPAPVGDGTRYVLQAGAFQASGQAEELKAKIALLGLGARVESTQIKGTTVYRVRMGPYGTASDLAEAKRKLASGGLDGMAVKVD